jgi:oxalate decarboxylase
LQATRRLSKTRRRPEVFKADRFEEIGLSNWLAHSPTDMVAETLNIDPTLIAQIPNNNPAIVPA